MEKQIRIGRQSVTVRETLVDRVVQYFDPVRGQQRFKARVQMALAGGYAGASRSRRSVRDYNPDGGSANADLLPDLPTLRDRSRDLVRNNPLATGAVSTAVTNVVGNGLVLQSRIDRAFLELDDKAADEWEENTEREFALWAESKDCDAARTLTFYGLQNLAFRSTLENGDALALRRQIARKTSPYRLAIQLIEGDRLCNKDNMADTDTVAGGVVRDTYGAPTVYQIARTHPGDQYGRVSEWDEVSAFAPSGLPNVLHLFEPLRIGQARGAPFLAPVIESLKMLGRYTEAELMAAVVSGMFTVFIKSESQQRLGQVNDEVQDSSNPDDYKLGNGSVVGLAPGDSIETADPKRPATGFDPFVLAILRQIGAALEIPFEIIIKNFNSSYSASRAAFEQAWKFFRCRRAWLVRAFCRPVYEMFLTEAIATGRISAPGFFEDPRYRLAYLGSDWIGPPKGHIDPVKENQADAMAEDRNWKTAAQNTAERGNDWQQNIRQRTKERRLAAAAKPTPDPAMEPDQQDNDEDDRDGDNETN